MIEIILIMITLFSILNMARFTRNEPKNAPIHWLKIPVGEVEAVTIEHVLVGTAKDFSEVMKYAVPQNMLLHRPDTVIAKILTTIDGKLGDKGEFLMLQSSAVNDLLGLMEEWQGLSKTKQWTCDEVDQFDAWKGQTGSKHGPKTIQIQHVPLHQDGSRTAYDVVEA